MISQKNLIKALHKVLAGDVIPFPTLKGKERKNLEKLTMEEWADIDIGKMKRRYKDKPEVLEQLEGIEDATKNKEPYKGGIHTDWSSTKKKQPPFPQNVGDLDGVLGKDVLMGGSDPFNWADHKYKVTKKLLQRDYDKPLEIHTRSDLIGHDDYIEVINPTKHKVFMHVASTDDEYNELVESGMPSVLRRLKAAVRLKDHGIKVVIAHDVFQNENLSSEAMDFNRLDEIKLQSKAKGIPVESYDVELSDKGAKLINDMAKHKRAG